MSELPFTGERYVPGARGEIWIEHWHRYHFASRWAAGRRVLDVACGEGYGSALLARSAAHVTGVDLSPEAIAHARRAYAGRANLAFESAPCSALPLPDASIDVVVSFETIEHVAEQDAFLDEVARVLRPAGVLVLSSPNRPEYSEKRHFRNPFHVKELDRAELAALVGPRFPQSAWYAQRPTFFSLIAPEAGGPAQASLVEVDEARPDEPSGRLSNPLYFLLVASRERDSVAALPPVLSVLADRDDWVHKDYEKVMRMLEESVARGEALERQSVRSAQALASLQDEIRALQRRIAELDLAVAERDAAMAARAADLSQRADRIAAMETEIARRQGWRWWLKLPLVRLGLLK